MNATIGCVQLLAGTGSECTVCFA